MRTLWTLFVMLCLAVLIAAGHVGARRVEHALAMRCALASDGTDGELAECFVKYGLPVPEDL